MFSINLKQMLNALAFANVGSISEFRDLIEQQEVVVDRPQSASVKPKLGRTGAPVVFCVVPQRIPQQSTKPIPCPHIAIEDYLPFTRLPFFGVLHSMRKR
jgi:hypothetical protein